MSKKYSRSLLRISVAQICQNLGWHSAQSSSLEVLTDVLERYLLQLGGTCHRYSEQFGRTEPNLDDLGLAFHHMGINLSELEDYVRHVDPVPFAHEVVAFPAPKPNDLGFPNPRSREILQHREEHIPDHLPYIFPNMKDEIPEEKTSPPPVNGLEMPAMTDRLQENGDKEEPEAGEKRSAPMSTPEMPPSKRSRFGNPNLPEEAGYSNYEMTCVRMGPNGVLTTRQGVQGRLPEPRMPPPNPRSLIEQANKENSGKAKDSGSGAKLSISVGGIGADGLPSGKTESKKSKKSLSKLHKKSLVHEQAAKAALEVTGKEIGKKTASSKAAAKFLKKLKQSKKSAKVFSKSKSKDLKAGEHPKDEDSPEKTKKLLPELSKKKKEKKQEPVDSEEELRNLCSPSSSRGSSPERHIINDGEGNAKKKARLEAIDDSINAVLRDSPVKGGKGKGRKKKELKGSKESSTASGEPKSSGDGKPQEQKVKRKPGRPPKVQKLPEPPPPVDIKPFVSDKFSSAELQVYEFNDSPPDASVKQRRPSAAELPPLASPPLPPPVTQAPQKPEQSSSTPAPSSKHSNSSSSSHRAHRKVEPEDELFAPEIKFESRSEPIPPPDIVSLKPLKLEYGKEKEKKTKDDKKEKMSEDKQKGKEEKTERQKEKKERHKDDKERSREDKEKHKEKEHKKDKKEKRKDKEKKKKHKERDREKDKEKKREEKVKQESRESRESSPAVGMGVKLKIKIGGAGPPASVVVTGEGSSPASPVSNTGSKRESMSPPKVIPKLYISKKGQEEKTKKSNKLHHGDGPKRKSSPVAVSGKSRSSSPSSNKASPSPRSTPTPPVPRKTPTPPPPHKSPSKESQPSSKKDESRKEESKKEESKKEERSTQKKKSVSPVPKKERESRSPFKDKTGRKEKKKERKRSLSSLSSLSSSSLSSLSPVKTSSQPRRQSPPQLQRMSSSSPEKSPPSLPFQSPTPSPRASSRAARSPSHTSSPHRSPTPPPALSRRKPTPPPALSPANARHQRQRSPSPSPTKPPTPGSTSPAASPDWNLPESPSHHRSPTPTPRTPTASPSRNIPSPSHSSPPTSPYRRSPSPVLPSSRPSSRLLETPEPKLPSKDNPSPASSGKSSSSLGKPNRTVEAETVCVFYDDSGQKVWICPACKKPDDGSEMIGCDMCDNWYHWPCANITEAPPEEQQWFCGKCLPKTKASNRGRGRPRGRGRGRGRKKIT